MLDSLQPKAAASLAPPAASPQGPAGAVRTLQLRQHGSAYSAAAAALQARREAMQRQASQQSCAGSTAEASPATTA